MATSVEARVPLIDHQLVEFAFARPRSQYCKWRRKVYSKSIN